jgi:polyisoprenoid-binding protein YceI
VFPAVRDGRRYSRKSGLRYLSLARSITCILLILWGLRGIAFGANLYSLNNTVATIGFSVRDFWLFSSQGKFRRFQGTLLLNLTHPSRTRVAVTVEARSISMPWPQATARLRSPLYFDAARYPVIQFHSTKITAEGHRRYRIDGLLKIRGVTRPLAFDARLVNIGRGPKPGTRIADFEATGIVARRDFGMTADRILISNAVHVVIHARILLLGIKDEG